MAITKDEFLRLFNSFVQTGDQCIFDEFLEEVIAATGVKGRALANSFGIMSMSDNAMSNSSKSIVAAKLLKFITEEEARDLTIEEFKVVRKKTTQRTTV